MNMMYRKFEISITRTASGEAPVHIGGTSELLKHIKTYYEGVDRELVLAVVLDDINSLLGIYEVSRGGKNEAPIDAPNVFRPALMLNASKVILVHNHPTGDTRPSEGDVRSAKAIFMLGSL
ncbi:MAG: JAB domain-containing protein, partial [Candidatus Limnocylindrus sp.]